MFIYALIVIIMKMVNKMKIKQAIELCEEYGWNVSKGKYFLEDNGDERVIFSSNKELIDYAKMLKKERQ